MTKRAVIVTCLSVGCVLASGSCGSSFSQGAGGSEGTGGDSGSSDAASQDVAVGDATSDMSVAAEGGAVDAPVDSPGPDAPQATYSDITDPGKWQQIAIPLTIDAGTNPPGYFGAAFDGQNVYYAPSAALGGAWTGVVSRFDTAASFLNATAWSSFDMATVNPDAVGFIGAEFDGRYVYYVPFADTHGSNAFNGLVLRYDTHATFSGGTSYDLFDTTSLDPNAKGFAGGAFDGRYIYLAPYDDGNAGSIATRFDTTASFDLAASWETFDTTGLNATAAGYLGAVFDGRYVYYAPYGSEGNSGMVSRFDTTGQFTSAGAWTTFDLTTVHSLAEGFDGAVFDGRYVYFVPFQNFVNDAYKLSGRMARLDTQGQFADATSWATFDMTTVNANAAGFAGGIFDGRYVYVIPQSRSADVVGAPIITARYDTTAPFGSGSSWSTFDLSQVSDMAYGFGGGAFDGEYVYYVPTLGVAVRFDAKTPPSMPPSYKGSFF